MFGDAFPSQDSDQLPGAYAWTQAPSQVNPTPNDTGLSLSTILSNSQMDTLDPITSVIVGRHRRHDQLIVFREGHDHLPQHPRPLSGGAREVRNLLSSDAGPLCQDHGPARSLGERHDEFSQAKHYDLCRRRQLAGSDIAIYRGRQDRFS